VSVLLITLRLLHVVGGIIWVGSSIFSTLFLGPAMQDAGPDAAKVAAALQRRGMMTFMPLVAIATIVSGIWLYWRDSGGFNAGYMASPIGFTFGLGGVLALSVFVVGVTVGMPAMHRAGALQKTLGSLPEPERAACVAEIGRLQARAGGIARGASVVLLAAAVAMAIARYL
jgi:uncharacterized membrane protein